MPYRTPLLLIAALACCLPWVSAPLALAFGLAVGLGPGNPRALHTRVLSRRLLQVSVVGLGFGLGLGEVAAAGRDGLLYTLIGITATLALGVWLGRRLGVTPRTASLISFGTAICGGSAIAALAPVIEADEDEIAVSLATVFSLNAVALFLFPWLGARIGLDEHAFGLWAALAIHDTSSVVGAGAVYGTTALAVATTVKLARAAWIAPAVLLVGWRRRRRGGAVLPWFIVGFVAAAALRTLLPALEPAWDGIAAAARRLLVLVLFLVGAGMGRDALRAVGARPLAHGILLWLCVGSATLLGVWRGWID